jgi:hypothetical protein
MGRCPAGSPTIGREAAKEGRLGNREAWKLEGLKAGRLGEIEGEMVGRNNKGAGLTAHGVRLIEKKLGGTVNSDLGRRKGKNTFTTETHGFSLSAFNFLKSLSNETIMR